MEIKVNYLDNLRVEAKFDDYRVIADQPIRYKGDGSAPSPFDYFLASSALCAGYFVKVYCNARGISTENIRLSQNNIIDPKNRYKQTFKLQIELPEDLSEKDKTGILRSIDRCTVKKVVQTGPDFQIEVVENLDGDAQAMLMSPADSKVETNILGKDLPLETTIANMTQLLSELGMKIEVASWRNLVPNVWSLHIRDSASPKCFTNGKGASQNSALCSALGEFIERLNCNFFYNDQYFGEEIADSDFVHYPNEKWFPLSADDELPEGLLDKHCLNIFNPDNELRGSHLIDTNSGRKDRGICSLPFSRYSDGKTVYFPSNLIENLYLSNGMSAGNNPFEAKVQCLSEIFERAVKKQIIEQEITLPEVSKEVLKTFPDIQQGLKALEDNGYPVVVKDASLGGQFPVMCVTLMNPKTGGVFASFGAHPRLQIALERSLTELLQGRSFEGLNDIKKPTFNSYAVQEPENLVEHFIDSSGVISWKFFSDQADYEFCNWDFSGKNSEQEFNHLVEILKQLDKEIYIAEYNDLGTACRILVPGYSEIYPVEDLIWDNTNVALDYREDILNIHSLSDSELQNLVQRLEQSQLDNYTDIITLIGIEFDENTVWGQLTILELKLMIYLALGELNEALDLVEEFLQYNVNSVERNLHYQAMQAVLEITLDDEMNLDDYTSNLNRMFGTQVMEQVIGSVDGNIRFSGLFKTSMQLEGIEPHLRLLQSYKKLHSYRAQNKLWTRLKWIKV